MRAVGKALKVCAEVQRTAVRDCPKVFFQNYCQVCLQPRIERKKLLKRLAMFFMWFFFFPCSPYAALLVEGTLCKEHRCSPSEGRLGSGPGTQPPGGPSLGGSTAAFAGRISRPVILVLCSLLLKKCTIQGFI